jgi:tRNA-dihydrouridine synthase B
MSAFKLYLAPLRGFTDYIYRNAFAGHFDGFDGALAPFIPTVTANRFKPSHFKDVLPENNPTIPIVPQIISNLPDDFINLAVRLFDLGYTSVNWNLGCPFPMVAKKHRGSGMLPYPDKIDAFLEKTVSAIPNRISIKTRLGRRKINEIFKLMPIFNRYPLEEIIIHPRTGIQMYDGGTDLETFEQCLEQSVHRIVYNGDITDLKSFRDVFDRFERLDGWMIGRGAVSDPFLPAIIKAGQDDITFKVEKFKQFYDELFEQYRQTFSGPGHLLNRMKGFWTYFSKSFQNSRMIVKKVHRTQKMDRYLEIVDRFFAEEAQWKK